MPFGPPEIRCQFENQPLIALLLLILNIVSIEFCRLTWHTASPLDYDITRVRMRQRLALVENPTVRRRFHQARKRQLTRF